MKRFIFMILSLLAMLTFSLSRTNTQEITVDSFNFEQDQNFYSHVVSLDGNDEVYQFSFDSILVSDIDPVEGFYIYEIDAISKAVKVQKVERRGRAPPQSERSSLSVLNNKRNDVRGFNFPKQHFI